MVRWLFCLFLSLWSLDCFFNIQSALSRWCTSFRKKAKQIVETWDKLFKSAQKEQRVAFLYLANDILQNSRRKGSEFVNEFWKVLPAALKQVYESGHESGKKVASRLVILLTSLCGWCFSIFYQFPSQEIKLKLHLISVYKIEVWLSHNEQPKLWVLRLLDFWK